MAKKGLAVVCAVLTQFLAGAAIAFDWGAESKVTRIASTNFPDRIYFQVDTNVGTCTAGTWLLYTPAGSTEARQIAAAQFAVAMLLTAETNGRKIAIYGNNDGCRIDYIHALPVSQ